MRVLMITLGYPKYPGEPTAPFIDAMARHLVDRGHSIDVVLPYHPEFRHAGFDGIRFFPYRYSPLARFSPWGFGQTFGTKSRVRLEAAALLPAIALSLRHCIARRLARDRYDVVHAHWVLPNGWLAEGVARARGVPIVITLHGSDVAMAERYRLLGRLARRTFEAADAVTATSAQLIRRAIALGADPRRSTTIYIGVDTELFSPRLPDPELRASLGAADGTFLVVSVGRLAEVKGFEYLIDAASLLSGVSIAIVGDGELRGELERRARSTSGVRLVGSMSHDRVADAIAAADAVVIPSVVDRAGRVDATTSTVLETLASGRPLVTTNVGGIPEIVEAGSNGLLVPPKDPRALASAITQLRDDPSLRERLGRQGRQFALDRLSWEATAEALEEAYKQVVSRPARRRSRSDGEELERPLRRPPGRQG
jgi:glycosyltransferase involved in cell wall biosynthesis